MILESSNNKRTPEELNAHLKNDPQYRRELSISYFNSLNNAVEFVLGTTTKSVAVGTKLELIKKVRDQFLEEYKQYRVNTLDAAGKQTIDPKTVAGLDKAKKTYENKTGHTPTDGGVVQD